mmetsp:Transcript_19302/g.35546  ORF Transcript_19302/g.35546 Transcript_19302/m.35546 type:complete len:83 (-) Transcript_19302:1825-2073(-)
MFRLYLDLLSEGTAPKPTDYMMYAEVLLHMQNPMWESLLRPWNLRTNRAELLDYTKFRLRMPSTSMRRVWSCYCDDCLATLA